MRRQGLSVGLSDLSWGARVAGIAGVALVISLFLPWYGVTVELPGLLGRVDAPSDATGWKVLGTIDLVLLGVAALALTVTALAAIQRLTLLPVPVVSRVLAAAGGLALTLVVFRVLEDPFPGEGAAARRIGIVVALVASAGVACAGRLLSRESFS